MKKELEYRLEFLKRNYPQFVNSKTNPDYVAGWIAGYMWGWDDYRRKKLRAQKGGAR